MQCLGHDILELQLACLHAGEVTLTGRILPIGGVKEKALAARRAGVTTILFPEANRADYDELSGAPWGRLRSMTSYKLLPAQNSHSGLSGRPSGKP